MADEMPAQDIKDVLHGQCQSDEKARRRGNWIHSNSFAHQEVLDASTQRAAATRKILRHVCKIALPGKTASLPRSREGVFMLGLVVSQSATVQLLPGWPAN